jgi:hypothetical protein
MADHLINNESIYVAGVFSTISSLKALNTSGLPQQIWAYVEEAGTGEYYLDFTSTEVESLPNVILPTLGSGRWIRKEGTSVSNYNIIKRMATLQVSPDAFLFFNDGFGIDVNPGGGNVLNFGTTNSGVINIGNAGSTVNVTGTLAYNNVTNLAIADKLITLNQGGAAASGMNSGFEIEEGGSITGSFTVDSSRNGFAFQAPALSFIGVLDFSLLTANRILQMPDEAGILSTREWVALQAFLTGNQLITLSGHVTGSGTTSIVTTIPSNTIVDSMVNDVNWGKLTFKPTTISGFGITDGVTLAGVETLSNKTLTSPKINVGGDATGDIYYRDSSGNLNRLAVGTSSQVLSGGSVPVFVSVASALGYTPLNKNGDTMTGLLILSGDPVSSLGAATKSYVDNLFTGLSWKQSVVAATTANITLSGTQTIDGVAVVAGDRVLIKDQTTASDNGIYIAASGSWTRALDNDSGSEIASTTVLSEGGTLNGGTQWNCSNTTITLGTTAITFVKIAGAGVYTNGTGLSLTGNAFSIDSTVATLSGSQTLTNKTLTSPVISTISNSGTLTLPSSTDTLVGRSTTDTLTNKTLTSPKINVGSDATGDIYYRDASGILTRLAVGTSSQILTGGTIPAFGSVASALGFTPVNRNGDTMTGLLVLSGDPVASLGAATKNYVDNFISGLTWKQSVVAGTTANITLSGAQTIDGISVIAGDRVLVKDQSSAAENGIYVAASGAWARATDNDSGPEIANTTVLVEGGTANGGTQWNCSNTTITVGTTAVTFAKIAGAGVYTNGTGLALTGNIFSIDSTVATLSGTQTLTNKTLTSPVISTIVNSGTLTLPTSTDTLIGRATTDTLTNKTLTSPVISTIVNTGTLTLPTSTDTLVGRSTTDTLSNKTLTSPKINVGSDATGDIYYRDASGNFTRLPVGTSSQVLTGGTIPAFASVASVLGFTPVNKNGDTMTGLLILSGDPVASLGAATKNYVDNLLTGITWKQSVVAATTANITLSGTQTIDGISVIAGDRVLVKSQTSGAENGIYVAASGAWTRATDNDSSSEISNTTVLVEGGTANGGTQWNCSNTTVTVGTTAVTFVKIAGAGVYTNGTGLSLTGNTFSIDSTVATLSGSQTLTNKTLTSPVIGTIVNTGTLTLPTSTDTLVGRATTDTLTNKTLTSPVISTIVNTGTLTLPTSTDTLIGRATTDTLTNKTLTSPKVSSIFDTSGSEILRFNHVASAVNWIDFYNAATTTSVRIVADGSDTNVNLSLESKGTNSYVDVNTSTAIKVASGTTVQRPSTAVNGMVRYNTTTNKMESYENGVWTNMIGAGSGPTSTLRSYQFSMLGTANATTGALAKASDTASGTLNPSGAPTTTSGNPGINNGIVDPYLIPQTATITSLRIKFAAAAVSTGTVGTPTVRMRIYKIDYSTRTQLGSDIDITISTSGVGVSNNLSGNAYQTAVATGLSIAVSAGDMIGVEFVNQSATNNGINAIARLFAVMETSE